MSTQTTIRDLSHYHALLTDLFSWPSSKAEWDQYRLSDEQVEHFHAHGYVSNVRLLNERQIERLKSELAAITNPAHPGPYFTISLPMNQPTLKLYYFTRWGPGALPKAFTTSCGTRLS